MKTLANILLIIFLFSASILFAQTKREYSVKNKKAIAYFEQSENFIVRGQHEQAIELLKQAVDKAPDFSEAHLRLSGVYRNLGSYDKALHHLEQASTLSGKNEPEAYFALGELYYQLGQYQKALNNLETFVKNGTRKQLMPIAGKMIESAKFALEQLENPLPFNPEPLPQEVNAFPLQYFPVLTVDQRSMIYTRRLGSGMQHDEDIFIVERDEEGNWKQPVSISDKINTDKNEGTSTISADGRTLIFTSCRGRSGQGSCDLYVSYKTGEEWTEPKNMGSSINSPSWESQPSLSADGRTLYFVSTRQGGYGKRDIYVSTKLNDDSWSTPKNLGPTINTPFDEIGPFIHANDQTLYFASDGHVGMGNFDLFVAEKEKDEWKQPKNLGYPINNHNDQVALYVTADGTKGYYSYEEMRNGVYVKSLIYSFDIPEAVKVKNRSNYVTGGVYDAQTKKPIGAEIKLYDIIADQLLQQVSADPVTGKYYMVLTEGSEYALYVNKQGYLFKSLAFDYGKNNTLEPIKIDVYLEPIKTGMVTALNNIFFEYNSYQIQPKSETELNRVAQFLKENPKVRIQVAGHTDDTGSTAYNLELSQKRAQEVFNYLVKAGIAPARLEAKGYGQTKPLLPNSSEENRQKNRRIEFIVL